MKRPLIGEPLAVDLLNTAWRHGGRHVDLLATVDGLAQWFLESGQGDAEATEPARTALVRAREAIRAVVEGEPGAEEAVNGILARGLTVRALRAGTVEERVIVADEAWAPAWRAVTNFVGLIAPARDAIRQCHHPDCVLWFHDPSGRRRWCSMAGCGNRAKARRHHARQAGRSRSH